MLQGIHTVLRTNRETTNEVFVPLFKPNRDRLTQRFHNTNETITDIMRGILPGRPLHTVAHYAPNTRTIPPSPLLALPFD